MRNRENAFLAVGPAHRLPYPPFSIPVQHVVIRAVLTAWDVVRDRVAAQRTSRREVPITMELQRELNRMLNSDNDVGFTASIFETVIRGGETENIDESAVERRPDLTFRLAGGAPPRTMREHYAMFTECKLLDASHSLRSYCDSGLRRFVDCEYAWAMSHALMLAYALPTIAPGALADFLCSNVDYRTIGQPVLDVAPPTDGVRSSHGRQRSAFASESGPVAITHV